MHRWPTTQGSRATSTCLESGLSGPLVQSHTWTQALCRVFLNCNSNLEHDTTKVSDTLSSNWGESKILRAPLAFERQDLLDNSKWSTMTMVFMYIAVCDQTHFWIRTQGQWSGHPRAHSHGSLTLACMESKSRVQTTTSDTWGLLSTRQMAWEWHGL